MLTVSTYFLSIFVQNDDEYLVKKARIIAFAMALRGSRLIWEGFAYRKSCYMFFLCSTIARAFYGRNQGDRSSRARTALAAEEKKQSKKPARCRAGFLCGRNYSKPVISSKVTSSPVLQVRMSSSTNVISTEGTEYASFSFFISKSPVFK